MMGILTNLYLWMTLTFLFLAFFILSTILIIVLAKKTHAIVEFKSWIKGEPICMFFQENRYVDWRPKKPEAGIVVDDDYGAFIVNERATYIDKRTKNVIIPFDASIATSVNIHAAKLSDDLQYIVKDEEQMKTLRCAIANNTLDDSIQISSLKTSIHLGAIKNMMTALIPHNINAKIEKTIAARTKGMGKVNVPQVLLIFAGMLGAILLGAMIIKLAFNQ